jgi:hypothetical protein
VLPHAEIGRTFTAGKLNLTIIAPDASHATAGRLDERIRLADRML